MSATKAVIYLLHNNATLIAQVPAARIMAGTLPQTLALPAIHVRQISGTERLPVSMAEAKRFRTERVQVTVLAGTYPALKLILELVRNACSGASGSASGVVVDSVLPDGVGPDLSDEAAQIFEQSRDFMVNWVSTP
ncbi:MAG: hypothetical protein IPM64_17480 [Phycisphaerales bacterium]|nr:hypothetical protein [Phycisphaerales bacterium]